MTQFLKLRGRFFSARFQSCALLLCLLLGSFLGALCVRFRGTLPPGGTLMGIREITPIRVLFRALLFPVLVSACGLLKSRLLTRCLFFMKGFLVCWVLCLFSGLGLSQLLPFLPVLVFETLLPMPCLLCAASVWCDGPDGASEELWLLGLCLLPGLLGVLMELLLFY